MKNKIAKTLGQRLKQLRIAAGLSQERLARAARVPAGSLRNWEYDKREPLVGPALRVARALGVSLDQLAGGAAKEKPKHKRRK